MKGTLGDLVNMAWSLHDEKRWPELVSLVLCGIGPQFRFSLTRTQAQEAQEAPEKTIRRFYGTIYGLSAEVLVRERNLILDDTFSRNGVIDEDVGMYHSFTNSRVCSFCSLHGPIEITPAQGTYTAPLHTIPNALLGRFSPRDSVIIVFPELHDPTRSVKGLTKEQHLVFWDAVIASAIASLQEGRPTSTATSQQSEPGNLPPNASALLASAIQRQAIAHGVSWMKDIRFLHLLLPDGEPSFHSFDRSTRVSALSQLFTKKGISPSTAFCDVKQGGSWEVDVGLEARVEGKSVIWNTDNHEDVYRQLTGLKLDIWDLNYEIYCFSHMLDLSTCRIFPIPGYSPYVKLEVTDMPLNVVDPTVHSTTRINAYHTLEYTKGGSTFLTKLARLYRDVRTHFTSRALVRTPLCGADMALSSPCSEWIWKSCSVFETRHIWLWRGLRSFAIDKVLAALRDGARRNNRLHWEQMLVLGSVHWLINTLHQTEDVDTIPSFPPTDWESGIICLQELSLGEDGCGPFFNNGRQRSDSGSELDFIEHVGDNPGAVFALLTSPGCDVLTERPMLPAPYGVLPVRDSIPYLGNAQPTPLYITPGEYAGIAVPGGARDSSMESPLIRPFVDRVFALFLEDIYSAAAPGVILKQGEYLFKDPDLLNHENLGVIFRTCSWKHASMADWCLTFQSFFPERTACRSSHPLMKQGHKFFGLWLNWARTLGRSLFKEIRCSLWIRVFRTVYWIPACDGHRIWSDSTDDEYRHYARSKGGSGAVYLLVNGPLDPVFTSDTPEIC
ncbi:hypothetical protein NMY22_g1228 [Coprinellus aureogranulatus]|nr:hypothetical protein NMY22_g1228 [Coprinellus aureogranulatus]